MRLKIITVPHPILRQKAEAVAKIDKKITDLLNKMVETLAKSSRPGVGLAAPQVGFPLRIVLAKTGREASDKIQVVINPQIIKRSVELELGWEGCLSIPNTYGQVERNVKIVVKGVNREGQKIVLRAANLFARILQHEIDHLEGVLITDKIVGKALTEEEYNLFTDSQTRESVD